MSLSTTRAATFCSARASGPTRPSALRVAWSMSWEAATGCCSAASRRKSSSARASSSNGRCMPPPRVRPVDAVRAADARRLPRSSETDGPDRGVPRKGAGDGRRDSAAAHGRRAAAAGEAVRKTAPERPSARFWEQARLVANAGGLLWFATTVPFLVTFASSAAGLPVGVVVADGLFLA